MQRHDRYSRRDSQAGYIGWINKKPTVYTRYHLLALLQKFVLITQSF
jgi:hypothetical protein